jgi:cytochrome oxidase Cu insertion factor (SCO1/SenC/PrrC family)
MLHTPAAALAYIVVATLALGGCRESTSPAAAPPPAFGGDFTLTNQDGQPFRLSDVRGRPAFLFFGYTSCPDMCPVTMSRIAGALRRAGRAPGDVATIFISVDPRRDTPAVLKDYVGSFSVPLIGLTGSEEDVRRVAAMYHASFQPVSTGTPNYLVNHTSAIFLIDRQGKLRQFFKFDESPDTLAAALRAVLDEPQQ